MALFFFFVLVIAGCMKHAPVEEHVSPLPPIAATPEDKKIIVAKVNGAEITRHSLVYLMNKINETNNPDSPPDSRENIRKKALDRLVVEELVFQDAKNRGLHLEPGALDSAMGKIKAKLGTEAAYANLLAKQNITETELRSSIERSLLVQLIYDKEVNKKISVSDDDVRKEYERQKNALIVPAKVTVDDVLLFVDQNDPSLTSKIHKVLAAIDADKDKDPMNLVPDGTFIVRSLEVDKEQEPALYEAALKLKPGELSGMIKSIDSVHIIKLTQYTPEKQLSFDEVKGSLESTLKTAARKKRLREWETELKKSAKIEIMEENRGQKSAGRNQKAEAGKD